MTINKDRFQIRELYKVEKINLKVKDTISKFFKKWKIYKENSTQKNIITKYCKIKKEKPKILLTINVNTPILYLESSLNSTNKRFNFLKNLDNSKQTFYSKTFYSDYNNIEFKYNYYEFKNFLNKSDYLYKDASNIIDYYENLIDTKWFNLNNKYIKNLNTKDIYTIRGYTFLGDIIINNYIKNNYKITKKKDFYKQIKNFYNWFATPDTYFPLFFQAIEFINNNNIDNLLLMINDKKKYILIPKNLKENEDIIISKKHAGKKVNAEIIFNIIKNSKKYKIKYLYLYLIAQYLDIDNFWCNVINMYIKDLERIIKNSPPLIKQLIVYRGTNSDYNQTNDFIYKTNSFISTTLNLKIAMFFSYNKKCCLVRIIIPSGYNVLFISGVSYFSHESEILIGGNDTTFSIIKDKDLISKDTTDICNKDKISVTDMIIV